MSDARKKLFVMPQPGSADAPNQLIQLFHLIGDEICDLPENVTRPPLVRTIWLSDAFPHSIHPELDSVLFSFNTNPSQAKAYAPHRLQDDSVILVANANHDLRDGYMINRDMICFFQKNGWASILYPEGQDDLVLERRSSWKNTTLTFLESQNERFRNRALDLGSRGHLENDQSALMAGRMLVAMGQRAIGITKLLDPGLVPQSEERRSSPLVDPRRPDRLLPTAHSRG